MHVISSEEEDTCIPEAVILLLNFYQPHAQPPRLRHLSDILASPCPSKSTI